MMLRRQVVVAACAAAGVAPCVVAQMQMVPGTTNGFSFHAESGDETHKVIAFAIGPDSAGWHSGEFSGDALISSEFLGAATEYWNELSYRWETIGLGTAELSLEATFIFTSTPDWWFGWDVPSEPDAPVLTVIEVATGEVMFESFGASGGDMVWLDVGVPYRLEMNYSIDFSEHAEGHAYIAMHMAPAPGALALFAVAGIAGRTRRRRAA